MESINNNYESMDVSLEDLDKIEIKDLKPGDIICTYEPESTKWGVRLVRLAQMLKKGNRNLVHMETVLLVDAIRNKIKVAHADGISKRIRIETQDLDRFSRKTSFLVQRAKDPDLRQKIKDNAIRLAKDENNKWELDKFEYLDSFLNNTSYKTDRIFEELIAGFCPKNQLSKAKTCAQFQAVVILLSIMDDPFVTSIMEMKPWEKDH